MELGPTRSSPLIVHFRCKRDQTKRAEILLLSFSKALFDGKFRDYWPRHCDNFVAYYNYSGREVIITTQTN